MIIENIFRNSERRVDVDKWYTRLVRAMFDVIPRIALENSKIPADVIKMGTSFYLSSSFSMHKFPNHKFVRFHYQLLFLKRRIYREFKLKSLFINFHM